MIGRLASGAWIALRLAWDVSMLLLSVAAGVLSGALRLAWGGLRLLLADPDAPAPPSPPRVNVRAHTRRWPRR